MFTQGDRGIRKGTLDGRLIEKACLGSNDLFYIPWLRSSTVETILTNFGQTDGPIVIDATNQYLEGIGDTGATNIANYINEDPMMVCSLGLQPQGVTMPIRKISTNTGGYIRSSIKEENLYGLKFGMRVNGNKANWASYVGGTLDNFTIGSVRNSTTNAYIRYRTSEITQYLQTSTSKLVEYEFLDGKIKVNGVQQYSYSGVPFSTSNRTYITFGDNGNGGRPNYCSFSHAELYDSQNVEYQYLPFVRQEVVGMIEINTNTMAQISGTWTISYELPDGTTWTPLNA